MKPIPTPARLGFCHGLLGLIALLAAVPGSAQDGSFFNQRDDQYTFLGLKRAQDAYQIAALGFERQRSLHAEDLISEAALDRARSGLSEAEVNYQQSILAVLFETQYVSVQKAVKYQGGSGKRVRLQLENTSGGGAELRHLMDVDDQLFEAMRPDVVHDVYVSLANDDGAIISRPYEAKLEELRFGHPAALEFGLLQDLDALTVLLTFGQGSQRAVKVFLQKDASVDRVVVQSEQFSQEVELGASAEFDLTLELFSGDTDTFQLAVVDLPGEINRYFQDPGSGARLNQFKFTESTQTRKAALQVFLPDRAAAEVAVGRSIPFWVLVIPRHLAADLGDLDQRTWSAGAIAELGIGAVRLELVPRGVGELRVKAPQLYFPIRRGEAVTAEIELVNEGTRRLDNVEVTADPPLGWEKEILPALVPALDVGEEATVELRFRPPAEAPVGKYEIRIRSTSFSDNQPIEGEDKTVSVEIRPRVRVAPSAILIGAMVLLITGVVIAGVRLARR